MYSENFVSKILNFVRNVAWKKIYINKADETYYSKENLEAKGKFQELSVEQSVCSSKNL